MFCRNASSEGYQGCGQAFRQKMATMFGRKWGTVPEGDGYVTDCKLKGVDFNLEVVYNVESSVAHRCKSQWATS